MGNMLGLPLVDNPELAKEPVNSARIAAHYWRARGLNEIADKNDIDAFRQVTRRINGGLIGLLDRLEHWKRIQAVLT
jgi:putative chitinase